MRWLEPERAAALTQELAASAVTVLSNAACCGLYEGNLLAIVERQPSPWTKERLLHLRAERIVVATGSYETPLLFENNDLPGIMLLSGAQRLLHLHGVLPGKRSVIAGCENGATGFASALKMAGCEVISIIDQHELKRAEGDRLVERVVTKTREIACDLLIVSGPRVPEASLLTQAGAKLIWDDGSKNYRVSKLPESSTGIRMSMCGRQTSRVFLRWPSMSSPAPATT